MSYQPRLACTRTCILEAQIESHSRDEYDSHFLCSSFRVSAAGITTRHEAKSSMGHG